MKKKKITLLTAFLLIFTLVCSTGSVYAKSLTEISDEIKQNEAALEEGQDEEQELSKEIENLEVAIGAAENELASINEDIAETQTKVTEAEAELEEAQENVDDQNDNLNSRLRTMYKNGSIGFLDVLLGSGSISEFLSNVDMLKKVYVSDQDVLTDLEDDYKLIEEKKETLEELNSQLESQKKQQADKQAELTASKNEVSEKKANVVASNEALEDNIADLNAEADRIEAIIAAEEAKEKREQAKKEKQEAKNENSGSEESNSSGNNKKDKDSDKDSGNSSSSARFTWPVPGYTYISSDYGWRNCPFHGRELHSGIDMAAPYGTSVLAADDGKVIYSGWLGSYGNAVIISHGNSLYTLYGHNSSLVVSYGARVSKGQKIARVGSTGSSTGNHCHFEVRRGGNSHGNNTSPWPYLK